jgi:tyrosyl-tRNA synthetase
VWLDPAKTSPFDFYQYWRNVDDADIINCLKLLTFLEMDEIRSYAALTGSGLNDAKKRLAYEVTRIVHGQDVADNVRQLAEDLFERAGRSDNMPLTVISQSRLAQSPELLELLLEARLVPSKGEGRRLIQQNGIYLNDQPVTDIGRRLTAADFSNNEAIVRKGKKVHHRLVIS